MFYCAMDIQLHVIFVLFIKSVLGICPSEDFVEDHSKNKCYFVSSAEATWSEAKSLCEALDSTLAKVEDDNDHQFILQIIQSSRSYWIGLNDIVTEGTYVWTDNTPLTWHDGWRDDQPNGGTGQNCIKYHTDQKWKDKGCNREYYFLCEAYSWNDLLFRKVDSLSDIAVIRSVQVRRKLLCMINCLQTAGCRFVVVDMSATTNNCHLLKTEIGGEVEFNNSPTLTYYTSVID